jgi:hypothetical protein
MASFLSEPLLLNGWLLAIVLMLVLWVVQRAKRDAVIQLKRQGTGTRYQAIALHANEDVRRQHEAKGFLQGAS